MADEKKVKKITTGLVFSWIFSVFFIFGGLGSMIGPERNIGFGIVVALMGVVILPPFNRWLKEEKGFELSTGMKWVILIVGFIISATLMNVPSSDAAVVPAEPSVEAQAPAAPFVPEPTKQKVRSARLTIDRVTTAYANLQPFRLTVENVGDVFITPQFDVVVVDDRGAEIFSGSPMFDTFGTLRAGDKKTDEITLLSCTFREDGSYNVRVDVLDSDYEKLASDTADVEVAYWGAFS